MPTRALVTTYSFDAASDSRAVTIPADCEVLEVTVATIASGTDQSSVTCNAVGLTKLGTGVHSGAKPRISVWRLIAPATGSRTIVVTHEGGTSDKTGVAVNSWTAIDTTTPFDGFVTANGTSTTPTVNVSSATGDLVADAISTLSTIAVTQGAGQTELWDFMPVDGRFAGSHEAGAASVTMSWTLGESKEWITVAWNANASTGTSEAVPPGVVTVVGVALAAEQETLAAGVVVIEGVPVIDEDLTALPSGTVIVAGVAPVESESLSAGTITVEGVPVELGEEVIVLPSGSLLLLLHHPVAAGEATVVDTVRVLYDISASVVSSRRVLYDISAPVVNSVRIVYEISAFVTDSVRIVYELAGFVSSSRVVIYDISASITDTNRIVYDILESVVDSNRVLYDIIQGVTSTRRVIYDIAGNVQSSRVIVYDMFNAVASSRELKYDISASVIGLVRVKYDIDALGLIISSRRILYDVDSTISGILGLLPLLKVGK